jgi:hypothetical protein
MKENEIQVSNQVEELVKHARYRLNDSPKFSHRAMSILVIVILVVAASSLAVVIRIGIQSILFKEPNAIVPMVAIALATLGFAVPLFFWQAARKLKYLAWELEDLAHRIEEETRPELSKYIVRSTDE